MFKQANRLSKKKEIDLVFQKGRSAYDKNLGIKARKNEKEESRAAIIVSSKVSKKAVERNRIRRRIREILKKEMPKFTDNFDVLIIVLPEAKNKEYSELEKSVENNLKKLKIC